MRSMLIAAAMAVGGFVFAAAPAQADHDFRRGFERQMGRIVANHVAGVAHFAFVHGYRHHHGHHGYHGGHGFPYWARHRHHRGCGHRVENHYYYYPKTDRHHHGGGHGRGQFRSHGPDHGYDGPGPHMARYERRYRH